MMAPLIERNASLDTCCLLFVNNFYSDGTSILRRSDPDAGERQRRIKQNPPHLRMIACARLQSAQVIGRVQQAHLRVRPQRVDHVETARVLR